jgi:thymidylate kinase
MSNNLKLSSSYAISIFNSFVIEGIDRLGKSTLINNIEHAKGHALKFHYEKPKKLDIYDSDLREYQRKSFINGFKLLFNNNLLHVPIVQNPLVIFDRFHLGECVYSPMYRKYDGDYVFDLEQHFNLKNEGYPRTKLILLTTSDFSFIEDDGESFDFSKKEDEQNEFIRAFKKSTFKNKVMIDISNGAGGFKDQYEILELALKYENES